MLKKVGPKGCTDSKKDQRRLFTFYYNMLRQISGTPASEKRKKNSYIVCGHIVVIIQSFIMLISCPEKRPAAIPKKRYEILPALDPCPLVSRTYGVLTLLPDDIWFDPHFINQATTCQCVTMAQGAHKTARNIDNRQHTLLPGMWIPVKCFKLVTVKLHRVPHS